jgi:hypothetical protein
VRIFVLLEAAEGRSSTSIPSSSSSEEVALALVVGGWGGGAGGRIEMAMDSSLWFVTLIIA